MRDTVSCPTTGDCPYCDACFTGKYPIRFPKMKSDSQLGLF